MTERGATGPDVHGADDTAGSQWYRALSRTVDGGVYQLDADDRFVTVDDVFADWVGYTRDELLGEHASIVFDDVEMARTDGDFTESGCNDSAESGHGTPSKSGGDGVVERDLSLRASDDESIPRTVRLSALAGDDAGGTVGIVRKRPDRDGQPPTPGRELDRRFASILDTADVGVFVLDETFDVAWINETAEDYFGIDREEVLGRDKSEVIDGTIRHGVDDADGVAETVLATDDDSYGERFDCHVPPGDDREERWLEYRSKPIASGEYAGGRVELYYDVTEQHERESQLQRLNEAVHEWLEATSTEAVAERASQHFLDVLDLEINGVFLYDEAERELQPAGWSDPAEILFDDLPTFGEGEGIAWQVFETGEPAVYDEVTSDDDVYNPETPIRSEIILPIGDHGVVIIGSEQRSAFDDGDLMLAKIAASGLETTFDRIRHEQSLERERTQTEKLLQTAPVAVTVENADGEVVMANRQIQQALGVTERELSEGLELSDGRRFYDVDGDPVDPEEMPTARVRETGEPVFDEELAIERPSGERRWYSMNAAPQFGSDGELERVITVGEDITELKEQKRRLERRKHELETELSEILGRISDGFYALDDEWRFTHLNERAEELLGYSREELLGTVVWDVFPEVVDSDLDEAFRDAMESQESRSLERYSEPLGIWAQVQVYPSETGLSIYFSDVTERKEHERELTKYELIVETMEDGIYALDEDGRFTTVNEAYVELTGYDRDELIGSHASLVVDEEVMEVARSVAADETDVPTIEAELETKGGDRVPIESTVTTLTTVDGERERIGVVRDVAERRERQRKLEASEQRYRTLAENFPNGVVALFDDELRYTAAGGQLIGELGIDREAAIGQSVYERYPEELVTQLEPQFRAALEGEERSFELTYHGRDLLAHTLPIETAGDVYMGMLVVQNVTERKEYQRKLEASNERLEQFAYAVSHDLQEPLRMITSYLQLLEGRYADDLDADAEEFIEFAVDGAERMREMIDGLLEYSRVETRGNPFEPVALEEVLEEVRTDLQLRIEERDAEIGAEPLPTVRGDKGQLRQVFQNLLSNAIEYSGDEPPRIEVSAERTGDAWKLSVRDEGIGIDPDDQERVFEVFQRLHSREEHDGTGIGLALCRRIVERHGGEISVDSEPDAGATFSFTLPSAGDGTLEA